MNKSDVKVVKSDEKETNEKSSFSASKVIDNIKEKAHDFQDKAEHLREEATAVVKEKYAKVKDKSVELEAKVVDYTKKNPIKTIGFAVAAGALLAKLFHRRK